jgi:exopolysaccharide biosynthesis predicted pyruvyltransferase EpsI
MTLRQRILETLQPLIGGARRWALLDYPRYANAGDSAIWIGSLTAMRDLGLPRPAIVADCRTYCRHAVGRAVGDGPIVLSGGGNFGDLYPAHQDFREQVVRDFPENRIVQLPQTIHFGRAATAARAATVISRHRDFTLLVRDAESVAAAEATLAIPARLCPDMAFALQALPRAPAVTRNVLWLLRQDGESAAGGEANAGSAGRYDAQDWAEVDVASSRLQHWLGRRLAVASLPPVGAVLRVLLAATYGPVAEARLQRACRLLTSASRVVTDRLHGHILCVLLGVPHILLDDRYGKVRRFHQQWTAGVGSVQWAQSVAEAQHLAECSLPAHTSPTGADRCA